jgi:ABC-type glycerol-3-phosphate transport system substrate-binding protein
MMKKILSLFLAILLAFSAVACNGEGDVTTDAPKETDPPAPDTTAAPVAPETTETIQEDKTLNILFLGNSLMYYNDMPELFAKIAAANGKKVNVKSVTKGSATISDFTDERTEVGAQAIPLLKNQPWDLVIIEPSRRISPYENTVKAAELASAKNSSNIFAVLKPICEIRQHGKCKCGGEAVFERLIRVFVVTL